MLCEDLTLRPSLTEGAVMAAMSPIDGGSHIGKLQNNNAEPNPRSRQDVINKF